MRADGKGPISAVAKLTMGKSGALKVSNALNGLGTNQGKVVRHKLLYAYFKSSIFLAGESQASRGETFIWKKLNENGLNGKLNEIDLRVLTRGA